MPEFCEPWEECSVSYGEVLISRTLYGPTIAVEPDEISLGGHQLLGAVLRPYMDLSVTLQWQPTGVCYGPVASVMSLAPSETVTIGMRSSVERSISETVLEAATSRGVRDTPRTAAVLVRPSGMHRLPERGTVQLTGDEQAPIRSGASESAGGRPAGAGEPVGNPLRNLDELKTRQRSPQIEMSKRVELAPAVADECGSFLETVGAFAGAMLLGGAGPAAAGLGAAAGTEVAGAVEGFVNDCVRNGGRPGGILDDTGRRIRDILDATGRSETQRSERETVTTLEHELTVRRTFSNPYRDRSLQLRTIPVFQRYEVDAGIADVDVGLALATGPTADDRTRQPVPGPSLTHVDTGRGAARGFTLDGTRAVMESAALRRDTEALHLPMVTVLQRRAGEQAAGLARGLGWSGSWVVDNTLHVPLGSAEGAVAAWKLPAQAGRRLRRALDGVRSPDFRGPLPALPMRTVSIFIGTHIEPVAGTCILPDLAEG